MRFMKLNRTLIKLLCNFIPYRPWRRAVRQFLQRYSVFTFTSFRRFLNKKVLPHSVLLIEPNRYHGEILSGFASYFLKLGYQVDVLIPRELYKLKPFSGLTLPPPPKGSSRLNVFAISYYQATKLYLQPQLKAYEYVMLTSSQIGSYPGISSEISVCDLWHLQGLKNLLIVEHELQNIKPLHEQMFLNDKRLIVLGHFKRGIMVNPHYFGDFPKHQKNKVCRFVVVGGIDPKRKNHALLLETLLKLLEQGETAFKMVVIGRGHMQKISSRLRPFVEMKGFLNFPDLYQEMQKADFFLPLLDPNSKEHERYITTGVTGSAQLIYGFGTPPIIHQKFAEFYGFNKQNAIVFQTDFAKALQLAIHISEVDYALLRDGVLHLAHEVKKESIQNLKLILKK